MSVDKVRGWARIAFGAHISARLRRGSSRMFYGLPNTRRIWYRIQPEGHAACLAYSAYLRGLILGFLADRGKEGIEPDMLEIFLEEPISTWHSVMRSD